jgi:hypothetical protein
MKILHELCESQFCKGIDKKISKDRRDEDGRSNLMPVEELSRSFLVMKKN